MIVIALFRKNGNKYEAVLYVEFYLCQLKNICGNIGKEDDTS